MTQRSPVEIANWLVDHDPIDVVPWDDPLVEQFGHPPRSAYVETYWLSVIGPSSTWAIRRLSAWLEASPTGYRLSLPELGHELGLGPGAGHSSLVVRTLTRVVLFGFAAPLGSVLAVRRSVAPLSRRQADRLPERLAIQHERERRPGDVNGALCRTTSQVTGGLAVRSGKPAAIPSDSPSAVDEPALAGADEREPSPAPAVNGALCRSTCQVTGEMAVVFGKAPAIPPGRPSTTVVRGAGR